MRVTARGLAAVLAFMMALATVITGIISAAGPALASTSDTETSSANGKLMCTLSINVQGDKAVVSWTITGATGVTINPLTLSGKVPLKGSQTVDYGGNLIVLLIAKDADGNSVRCHAGAGGTTAPANGTTGFTDDNPSSQAHGT